MELKHRRIASIILILLCLVVFTSTFTVRNDEERESTEEVEIAKPSLWEIFKNGFSLYSSSPLKFSSYRDKFQSLKSQLHTYFIPPNLDFRGSRSGGEEARVEQPSSQGGDHGGGGAGEKMKEAVSKSFGKSKETVEDSAKSAAKAVGETVQKTKEKVKRSFSDHQPHEHEL